MHFLTFMCEKKNLSCMRDKTLNGGVVKTEPVSSSICQDYQWGDTT